MAVLVNFGILCPVGPVFSAAKLSATGAENRRIKRAMTMIPKPHPVGETSPNSIPCAPSILFNIEAVVNPDIVSKKASVKWNAATIQKGNKPMSENYPGKLTIRAFALPYGG